MKKEIENLYAKLISSAEDDFTRKLLQKEMEMKLRHLEQGIDAEQTRNDNSISCIGCGS